MRPGLLCHCFDERQQTKIKGRNTRRSCNYLSVLEVVCDKLDDSLFDRLEFHKFRSRWNAP